MIAAILGAVFRKGTQWAGGSRRTCEPRSAEGPFGRDAPRVIAGGAGPRVSSPHLPAPISHRCDNCQANQALCSLLRFAGTCAGQDLKAYVTADRSQGASR
jgi:hypothetical protein